MTFFTDIYKNGETKISTQGEKATKYVWEAQFKGIDNSPEKEKQ